MYRRSDFYDADSVAIAFRKIVLFVVAEASYCLKKNIYILSNYFM